MDVITINSSLGTPKMAQNINDLPEETLTEILSNLPQNNLVLCREVCTKWRDVIDQNGPIKKTIRLKEDDKFLSRKLELKLTSCELSYFQKTAPNISLLYPQTIKSFEFCDRPSPWNVSDGGRKDQDDLNVENARGLLLQIAPFVERLNLAPIYFQTNIIPGISPFPKLRELYIGCRRFTMGMGRMNDMRDNLEILFSHQFPLLDSLYLGLNYLNETLMDEACVNLFNFLANHRQTLKRVFANICYGVNSFDQNGLEFDLSETVKGNLSNGELQLESLQLYVHPKYVPFFAPIITSQQKLVSLNVGDAFNAVRPGRLPFYVISPGILSNACTLQSVILHGISSVADDGITWVPLDLSVFRDVLNLTQLNLARNCSFKWGLVQTPTPNENEEAWITNLNEIKSRSLKSLKIDGFICNSRELQILIDNSPVLETLQLLEVLAPRNSEKFAESGVHGGIIKSFVEKESKDYILLSNSMNYEHAEQNEKFEVVRKMYPCGVDNEASFIRDFSTQCLF